MKTPLLFLIFLTVFVVTGAFAQQSRPVSGTVADSLGTVPGVSVKLISGKDSIMVATNTLGVFNFPRVASPTFKITVTGVGYETFTNNYTVAADGKPVKLNPIKLKVSNNLLKGVKITAINPITIKEDTVEYNASAYKVREGSNVDELVKKMPGMTVDKDGNVNAHGKQVTKVRVNGKNFFTGDVQTALQNLPADVVENIQVIDDYGDQANLTGIKTGEPEKILNITIQKGKRTGQFGQATVGAGNDERYLVRFNANTFKEDRQISVIGTLNNTNANAFNFGGGGGRNSGGGGNGITKTSSLGVNYRNNIGKKITVYGSYSFADRDRNTVTTSTSQSKYQSGNLLNNTNSNSDNGSTNHRFDFNMEYKIDSLNYLKISPNFSYGSSDEKSAETFLKTRRNTVINGANNSFSNSTSPSGGGSILYNHKFRKRGRNFSFSGDLNFSSSNEDLNSQYTTIDSGITIPLYQHIYSDNSSNNSSLRFSYTEPLSNTLFLEASYNYTRSNTNNNRDNFYIDPITQAESYVDSLSTLTDFQFTTNRIGLNLRGVKPKYNYTIGLVAQPTTLDGEARNLRTVTHTFNLIPTARFVYNFKRNHSLTGNYNGSSRQPSFNQLQSQPDFSNPQNRVYGNPNLKPEFTNNVNIRYNQFDIVSGNSLFTGISLSETQNRIVTSRQLVKNPVNSADSIIQETRYLNTNGFYAVNGNYSYSKPFAERKFTATINGSAGYSNNISFIEGQRNLGKNYTWSQGARLRVDIDSLMDTEVNANYSINKTNYSLPGSAENNAKTWTFGLNGRSYFFADWILGYDLTQTINKGFSSTVKANPTIFSAYIERQFLKKNMASVRLQAFDIFDQNTGISHIVNDNEIIDSRTNRLARYFLLTFSMRLQKFAGGRGNGMRTGGERRQGGGGNGGGGRRGN